MLHEVLAPQNIDKETWKQEFSQEIAGSWLNLKDDDGMPIHPFKIAGDGILTIYDRQTGCFPEDVYNKCIMESASMAHEASIQIGFRAMSKASEGIGEKSSRMVAIEESIHDAYIQVCGKVPGGSQLLL